MSHETRIELKEGMAFDVELEGHKFTIDAAEEFGGKNYGPTPKPLLLSALAGCTGMDVVSLLRKMKVPFDSFVVEVDGDTTDEHPKVYKAIRVRYILKGSGLEENRDKIEKAVELSRTKYCGVAAMLGKTAALTYEIALNQ